VDDTQTPTGALSLTDGLRVQRSSGGATASEIAIRSRRSAAAMRDARGGARRQLSAPEGVARTDRRVITSPGRRAW